MEECLLVMGADRQRARSLGRVFRRRVPVVTAGSFNDAADHLAAPRLWLGGVIEVGTPARVGLALLDAFRRAEPRAPALVLSELCEPRLVNRVHGRAAFFAVTPTARGNLDAFADLVVSRRQERERGVEVVVASFAAHFSLSPNERTVLALSVRGTPRRELSRTLGLPEGTIKAQVRSLLEKCANAGELGDVVRTIWAICSVPRHPSRDAMIPGG